MKKSILARLNVPFTRTTPAPAAPAEEALRYLEDHRTIMDRRFLLVRLAVGLAAVGYSAVALTMGTGTPSAILVMISYLLASLGVWLLMEQGNMPHLRWLYAGLDLTFLLLLRYGFALEIFADSNVTLAGLVALILVAYTLYCDPRLSGVLVLISMAAIGSTLWMDAQQAFATAFSHGLVNEHALRATLIMGYLSAFGMLVLALTLFMRHQTLSYILEMQRRLETAVEVATERARSERLKELDRLKQNFIAVLSHELRTPLTPLCTSLNVLREELEDIPEANDPLDMLEVAQGAAGQLQHLVQDYIRLAELLTAEHEPQHWQNIRLSHLVDALLDSRAGHRYRLEDLEGLVAATDAHLLSGALIALMRRAELVTPADQMILLRGGRLNDQVAIEVHDPNSYLEVDEASIPDDPFASSSERIFFSPNTGLELVLARHSLSRINGQLRIESSRTQGTTITCIVPGPQENADWVEASTLQHELAPMMSLHAV